MTRFAITAAALMALSVPAFAGDPLAASVGVEPGVYTVSELAALKNAQDSDDNTRIAHIRNGGSPVDSYASFASTKSVDSNAGKAQLAASLGVDAADYSTAELAALKATLDDDGINN